MDSYVEKILNQLEYIALYFKEQSTCHRVVPYLESWRNKMYSYYLQVEEARRIIQSYINTTKIGIEENQELRDKIKALEAKEFDSIHKEKRNDFIDYLIQELEDLKEN